MSRMIEVTKVDNEYQVNTNAHPSVSKTMYCYKSEGDYNIIQVGNGCYSFYCNDLITESGEYTIIYGACWGGMEEPETESGTCLFSVDNDVITVDGYDDVTIIRDSSKDITV